MDKSQIKSVAQTIEEYVGSHIVQPFQDDMQGNGCLNRLAPFIQQLENRSKEYRKPSFVVLVVGPVKAGKSTFVNLVARNYVSPTHFLECTVRPSIISAGDSNSLTVYKSGNINEKSAQMDGILDCLNGLIENDEIKDVTTAVYDFTPENVDRYIKLDMINVQSDEILLTSIKTQGGSLMQEHVFIVDMAGFDGANVNFDTPAYQKITERADLIIFVQSSNSAISKVSSSFFELLKNRNHSVPVCLVHNVFEAAYWRSDEQKKRDIEVQKEHAISKIRSTYNLMLEDAYAFNLNLGKVNDLREGNYETPHLAALKTEAKEFEKAEAKMSTLFSRRESIRMKNCIIRTQTQQNVLLEEVNKLMEEMNNLNARYQEVACKFENLKRNKTSLPLSASIITSLDDLHTVVTGQYNMFKQHNLVGREKYSTEEARKMVSELMDKCGQELNKHLNKKLQELKEINSSNEYQQWLLDINTTAAEHSVASIAKMVHPIHERSVEVHYEVNVQRLVPKRRFLGLGKHSLEKVNAYLAHIKNCLCGTTTDGDVTVKGIIEEQVYPEIRRIIQEEKENYISSVIACGNAEIERLKVLALQQIIHDIDAFHAEKQKLEELKKNIENLKIEIHE